MKKLFREINLIRLLTIAKYNFFHFQFYDNTKLFILLFNGSLQNVIQLFLKQYIILCPEIELLFHKLFEPFQSNSLPSK